jgi:predicted phosphodiesterase
MRIAILSDIHGNPIALDAVLEDIQRRGGVDGYLILGDLVAQGFDPAAVLDRLSALPNAAFVRGNTDRYVLTGDRAWPSILEAQQHPDLVPPLVTIAQGFAWRHGYLSATGWLDWLARLPLEQHLTLPDGTRVLGVHASPGRDDGPGVDPGSSDEELLPLFRGCNADLVFVGHTHCAVERHISALHIVNVGSVSNPPRSAADRRTSYAIFEADRVTYRVQLRYVAYDAEAVIQAIRRSHMFPNPEWLIHFYSSVERDDPAGRGPSAIS